MDAASTFVVSSDPDLARWVEAFAGARMVFFAGLPGTGKSFLAHQVAHLASERGRTVHLLQWDVARPVFEASEAAERYPVRDGVTHAVVRKAVGLWAREAVVAWSERHADGRHLLIGETPFVGNRFIELARPRDDRAEPLLRAPACRFAIPVPSPAVRAFLESERERRAARPLHPREREDAPPAVLRDLWRELVRVASALGIASAGSELVNESGGRGAPRLCRVRPHPTGASAHPTGASAHPTGASAHPPGGAPSAGPGEFEGGVSPLRMGVGGIDSPPMLVNESGIEPRPGSPGARASAGGLGGIDSPPMKWDAELYRSVYEAVLRHRHVDVVRVDTVLPTSSLSVYDFAVAPRDVVPTAEEARAFIAAVEERYPSLAALDREIERWYAV